MATEPNTATSVVRARKAHDCNNYPRCESGGIRPGDLYLRSVAFPSYEFNSSGRMWLIKLCRSCAGTRVS